MTITIEPTVITTAAQQFADAHAAIARAFTDITTGLAQSGGMAGGDTNGINFGNQYNHDAAQALRLAETFANASAAQHEMLTQFVINHTRADAHAAINNPHAPAIPAWVLMDVQAPTIPSAVKDTVDEPAWWHYLASHLQGWFWPNGNPVALRHAATVWRDATQQLTHLHHTIAPEILNNQQGDGIEDAHGWSQTLRDSIDEVTTSFTSLADHLDQYADSVQHAHDEVIKELNDTLRLTVYIEEGAALLAPVTGMISEFVGNIFAAARIAKAARALIEIFKTLATAVKAIVARLRSALGAVGEKIAKILPMANARGVEIAVEDSGTVVAEKEAGGALAKYVHRPYMRKATREEILKRTKVADIKGTKFYEGYPAKEKIKIPVDMENPEWVTKLPKDEGGNYYIDAEHGVRYPVKPVWEFGHVAKYEHKYLAEYAQHKGWTQKEFNDYVNSHPEYFRVQDRYSNRARLYEYKGPNPLIEAEKRGGR